MVTGGYSRNRGWLSEGMSRASMLSRTILPGDEELGKKDDDHRPGYPAQAPHWKLARTPVRWRKRRILLSLVGLYMIYLLARRMPDWVGRNDTSTYSGWDMPLAEKTAKKDAEIEPTGAPNGVTVSGDVPKLHTYDGPLRFYRLAASLQGSSHTQGYRTTNRNVLFAMSSLKSAAALLPMICEMSRWKRNWVHAAFMGREDIPLDDLLDINGIDKDNCPAIWHDARPDYTEYSTDKRAEKGVIAGMMHIHDYLHPQVAIIDDPPLEDAFFIRGIKTRRKDVDMPIIEVPSGRVDNFMWITRLDAESLRNWYKPAVDILIQAPSDSSGGIIRLLKSLREADYSGLQPPRLTIELPADLDPVVQQYLQYFAWPPHGGDNHMTIRRRIPNERTTQEQSAIRFLELFYPTNAVHSHALLLSPAAELSPLYYHYIKYVILEYKYSIYGSFDSEKVMGASLELPSVLLDGTTKLKPPKPSDMLDSRYTEQFPETPTVPFLWQAPNSHAALFFGDKWGELHSFLSGRVKKQHQAPKTAARRKLVSETLPSWTEYMLELMRARDYSLIYPGTTSSDALVTVHNELYHIPDEFKSHPTEKADVSVEAPPKLLDEPFLVGKTLPSPPKNPEPNRISRTRPLHRAIPFDGDLPEIAHLPYMLYNGSIVGISKAKTLAAEFANKFREAIGGCEIPEGKRRVVVAGSAQDLFCFGDEDEDDWEDDTKDNEQVINDNENEYTQPLFEDAAGTTSSGMVDATASPTREMVKRGNVTAAAESRDA